MRTTDGRGGYPARGRRGVLALLGRRGRTADRKLATWLLVVGVIAFAFSAAGLAAMDATWPSLLWNPLDLQVYVWGGHAASVTGTPYLGTYKFNLYFTYPPIAAVAFELLSSVPLAVLKWLITSATIASLAAVIWLSWGKLGYRRSRGRLGATLLITALVLWLEPVQQTLAFGQVNAVLMLIVVVDLCLPDSSWLKGVGVGLAAGFKLTPLIFIPYLVLTRRYRAAAVALGTFGLTIAAAYLLLPKAAGQFWGGGLFLNASRVGGASYVGNQSLYGAALRLFGSPSAARPYWLGAVIVVGLAGLLLAAWLSRRGQELAGIVTCGLTGLLVSPISWTHHWVWIAPAIVALTGLAVRAGKAWRLRASWLAVTAAWLAVVAVLALFTAYPFHASPGGPQLPAGLIWTLSQSAQGGSHLTAYQELIGNVYVLAGLVGLTAVTAWLLRVPRQARRPRFAGRPPAFRRAPQLPTVRPASADSAERRLS